MKSLDCARMTALVVPASGPLLSTERDALDLISETYGSDVDTIAIPRERLAPAVFDLRSGLLGAFVQKLVNYQLRLAIVGDVSAEIAASDAFRDFVVECRRGTHVRFIATTAELAERID